MLLALPDLHRRYSNVLFAHTLTRIKVNCSNRNCNNLGQVPKFGTIHADNFPYVPSTLTAAISNLAGLAADAPSSQMQSVSIAVRDASGNVVATYAANVADLWGHS